jgi:hypothetical protein
MLTMGTTQHEASTVGVAWLVELDFAGGTQRLTTAPVNIVVGADTYTGLGDLLAVGALSESEDANAERVALTLAITSTAQLAAVLGDASTYRGRPVRLYLHLLDAAYAPVGSKVLRWAGYMEPVRINRSRTEHGTASGRIELPCSRAGFFKARNFQGLRHTHAQQLQRYPGDLGLQYLQDLLERPALWLSKKFQEV